MEQNLTNHGIDRKESNEHHIALARAADVGDREKVREILDQGVDVMLSDGYGRNALHYAVVATNENIELVGLLIDAGIPVDATDQLHCSALQLAIENGKHNVARFLLSRGASIHRKRTTDFGPLHLAIYFGAVELVEDLLERGADVEDRVSVDLHDAIGRTALHVAYMKNSGECIDLLIEYGADVSALKHARFLSVRGKRQNASKAILRQLIKFSAVCSQVIPPESRDFYNSCVAEVGKMKREKFYDKFSFYYLVSADKDRIAALLKNENFTRALESQNYELLFPLYGSLIDLKIRSAERKRRFLSRVKEYLGKAFLYHLPDVVLDRIANFVKPEFFLISNIT